MTVSLTTSPSASITAGLPAPYSRTSLPAAIRSAVRSSALRAMATIISIISLQWTPAYARVVTADRARPRFGSLPVISSPASDPVAYCLFNDSERHEQQPHAITRAQVPPHYLNRLAYGFEHRSHWSLIASAPQSQTVPPSFRHSARMSYSTTWIFQSSSIVRRLSGSRRRGMSVSALVILAQQVRRRDFLIGLFELVTGTAERRPSTPT